MKRYLPVVIIVLVGLLSIGGGIMLYTSHRPQTLAANSSKAAAVETTHVRGPRDARITLEEFGDFQCPPCGKLSEPLNELQSEFRENVCLLFRHLPLAVHAHARAAACAAEAAGLQGRFWEMHDLLYREQAAWSQAPDPEPLFDSYAAKIGLGVPRFKSDSHSEEVRGRIAADEQRAAALGVHNTPTIFLNEQSVPPSELNPAALRTAIQQALDSIR